MDKFEAKKFAFFLPNTFTALNMGCGFGSIIISMKGDFYLASIILLFGAVFDSVDGRVARLTGTQSQFGEQFDSLSDLISFGMAPALMAYNKFFIDMGRPGLVISFFFCLCGALRLARFNANIDKVDSNSFQGLPIPGAAVAMIGFVLTSLDFPILAENKIIPIIYVMLFSVLMITNIPFPSFKNSDFVRRHKKAVLFFIIVALVSIFLYEQIMVTVVILLYVLGSIIRFLVYRKKDDDLFEWKNESEE